MLLDSVHSQWEGLVIPIYIPSLVLFEYIIEFYFQELLHSL